MNVEFPLPRAEHSIGQVVAFLQQIEDGYSTAVGVIVDVLSPDDRRQLPTRYVLFDE